MLQCFIIRTSELVEPFARAHQIHLLHFSDGDTEIQGRP